MRSGLLNERLTVYTRTMTTDVNGAKIVTLTTKGSYWCRVLYARRDRDNADIDRVVYNPGIRFELRRHIPIVDSDIIEFNSAKYVISMIETNHNLDIQTLYCDRYEQ